ncbi:MAG: DUF58 domain-containing protein [Candidatus Kapaibacteriales bacterium]
MSNGDANPVFLELKSDYPFAINCEIIDEPPFQFQIRDFNLKAKFRANENKSIDYKIYPVERGEYSFGDISAFVSVLAGLIERRFVSEASYTAKVYPSYIHLRQHMLIATTKRLERYGAKRVRKIGRSLEFDQISKYTPGEDYRTINWKASARTGELMINRYTEEKSQPIYSLVDMGRSMRMPFENMTLADYAINTSLVLSALSIHKGDKAGLLTFSNEIDSVIPASSYKGHMTTILDALYDADTEYMETGYHVVYSEVSRHIKRRALVMLYTNMETMDVLERNLPYLKSIAKRHLLVTVLFKNTELEETISEPIVNYRHAATKTVAEELESEKREIAKILNRNGIQTIYTTPKNLTTDTINRYLAIKARNEI